jgi:hypothetical protein
VVTDNGHAALGAVPCPICGEDTVIRLPDDWQEQVVAGAAILIVGCGNPWHYANLDATRDATIARLRAALEEILDLRTSSSLSKQIARSALATAKEATSPATTALAAALLALDDDNPNILSEIGMDDSAALPAAAAILDTLDSSGWRLMARDKVREVTK